MKTMKKFWFLPLLLLGLAACGDDNTEPNQPVTPPAPTQVVICELTAPEANAEFDLAEVEGFEIKGNALINEGAIADVELKVGNTVIEEVDSVPFTYEYTFPAEQELGELVITLTVTGDREATDSRSVTVRVSKSEAPAPEQELTLTLTAPSEGYVWESKNPLTICGEGSANVGEIQSVSLQVGDIAISEVDALPFTYAFTAPEELPEGELVITLTAVGDQGAEATQQVTITHKKPQQDTPTPTPTPEEGTMVDSRDGKSYRTVTIGEQTWMAENLAYLPAVYPGADAANSGTAKRYFVLFYEGTDVGEAKQTQEYADYGVLYNWFAANDTESKSGASESAVPSGVQGVCPEGWHLPSKAEWQQLEAYVSSQIEDVEGDFWMDDWGEMHSTEGLKNVWSALTAVGMWDESLATDTYPDLAYGPRDTFGFSVIPAGFCWQTGTFEYRKSETGFWMTDYQQYGGGCVEFRNLQYSISFTKTGYQDRRGYSVRCVMD